MPRLMKNWFLKDELLMNCCYLRIQDWWIMPELLRDHGGSIDVSIHYSWIIAIVESKIHESVMNAWWIAAILESHIDELVMQSGWITDALWMNFLESKIDEWVMNDWWLIEGLQLSRNPR